MTPTPTQPAALLAPIETLAGELILVGRSDIDLPANSLLAIARASDCRQWLVRVQEPEGPHGSQDIIGELVIEVGQLNGLRSPDMHRPAEIDVVSVEMD